MKDYMKEYKRWCESAEFDEETKSELISIFFCLFYSSI